MIEQNENQSGQEDINKNVADQSGQSNLEQQKESDEVSLETSAQTSVQSAQSSAGNDINSDDKPNFLKDNAAKEKVEGHPANNQQHPQAAIKSTKNDNVKIFMKLNDYSEPVEISAKNGYSIHLNNGQASIQKNKNRLKNILDWFFIAIGFVFLSIVTFLIFDSLSYFDQPATVDKNSILVLNLNGNLVDDKKESIFDELDFGSDYVETISVFDVVQSLKFAENDKRIKGVYLNVDNMGSGWSSAREVRQALLDFKKSGKKIVSYSENIEQKQYMLVSVADTSILHPTGSVIINGISRTRQYYGSLLKETLGLDVYLFKAGKFKSAAEPYILDSASAPAKEADLFWISDVWERYIEDVSSARQIPSKTFKKDLENIPENLIKNNGSFSKMAYSLGWVDELSDLHSVTNIDTGLPNYFGPDVSAISFDDYVKTVRDNDKRSEDVAVIVAEGDISFSADDESISGDELSAAIDEAVDSGYSAIVLRINSPGGAVFPSEKIRDSILRAKKNEISIVASMSDMAASGGYMIAMDADVIYANESTVTGSIGVFGLLPNFNRALKKVGVNSDGVSTGPLANSFDPTSPMSDQMSVIVQSVIDGTYKSFTENAAAARKMKLSDLEKAASGRVWTGKQALDLGLIDKHGGLLDAIDEAAKLAGLNPKKVKAKFIKIGEDDSFLSDFLSVAAKESQPEIVNKIAASVEKDPLASSYIRLADPNNATKFEVMATCMCDIK